MGVKKEEGMMERLVRIGNTVDGASDVYDGG